MSVHLQAAIDFSQSAAYAFDHAPESNRPEMWERKGNENIQLALAAAAIAQAEAAERQAEALERIAEAIEALIAGYERHLSF